MRTLTSVTRTVLTLLVAAIVGLSMPAFAQEAKFTGPLRDGVVVDASRGVAYVMTPDALEAVNLSSGATLWTLPGVRKPLAVFGDVLLAHASRPGSSLAISIIQASSGVLVRDITIPLPDGIFATVVDTPGRSFRAWVSPGGVLPLVSWSFAVTTDLTTPLGAARAPRDGAFLVDPSTGSVVEARPAAEGDQKPLPGALEQQFRSGILGARPAQVNDVYALAQRAPVAGKERLVLRRWNSTTGAAMPEVLLNEGALAVPYASADGRYVIAGRATDQANETIWGIHDAGTGARISELTGRGAPGAFTVVEGTFVHVASAFGHRVGADWVDEPLSVRGLFVNSGGVIWKRTLLDTEYRGPMPPRTLQPSNGMPRLGTPKHAPLPPRKAAPAKAPTPIAPVVSPQPSQNDPQPPSFAGITWTAQGPGPITKGQAEGIPSADNAVVGAVHAVVVHPTDANIMYVAAANGGIWKTVNAKTNPPTWTKLTDTLESASIGALEFDPTDAARNTLVAASAKVSAFGGAGGPRRGLLRTTDGGANWTLLPSMAGRNILAIAPRGATIVAAVNAADAFTCPNVGVFRSTDTGATFTQVSSGGLGGGTATDLGSDPSNPAVLYTALRASTNCGSTDGIYKSTDTGATWTKVSHAGIDARLADSSSAELALNKSGHVFLGIIGANPKGLAALFRSTDGGASWTALDLPQTTDGGKVYGINPGGQGDTHFSIIGDRNNDNIVYVGGDRQPGGGSEGGFPNTLGANNYTGRLFRVDASKAAGSQVSSLTHCGTTPLGTACGGVQSTTNNGAPHGDSRDMATDPDGNVIEVDDGGIYKRTNPTGLGDWFSLNGNLAVNECHDVAFDTVSEIVICGTQDVGSAEQSAKGSATWPTINQGDGGDATVDPNTAAGRSTRYTSAQNLGGFNRRVFDSGNVKQSDDFPALTVQGGAPALVPLFVTPVIQNAITPARLIISGSNAFYETLDRGDTLTRLTGATNDSRVNAIAYGGKLANADNADLLYVGGGLDGDKVFVRTAAGNVLTETAAVYPGGTVIDLTIDPTDGAKLYVLSLMAGTYKVYASSNSGAAWRDITGNLATGTEFRTLKFISGTQSALVVGGYATVEQMAPTAEGVWAFLGTGLPKVLVYDLHYDPTRKVLAAGTLGRGAFTAALGGATQATLPTVANQASTAVTATSATLGGEVTSDGGSAITERGVVFSVTATNGNPLIGGTGVTKVTATGTTGAFTGAATGLTPAVGYSFKAYATNLLGTSYTAVGTFTTLDGTTIPRLVNIATRAKVQTGDNVMIAGFIIGGNAPKKVLITARGPSLGVAPFNVPGTLADPFMQLYSGQTVIDSNDDFGTRPNAAEIPADKRPSNAKESAILTTLNPGAYTAIVTGVGATSGIAIVEVFEIDLPQIPLINIATRSRVETGDSVMIAGFVIQGNASRTVLVTARGPSLAVAPFNVPNTLPDPYMRIFSGQTIIFENDNWMDGPNSNLIPETQKPKDPRDAALLVTLAPGAYTVIVGGGSASTASGVAIVEVFVQ